LAIRASFERYFFDKEAKSMDDCGFLAIPQSERNRVFDVIDTPVLQVNYPQWGSQEENTQQRRRGCGMWEKAKFAEFLFHALG
jgi:hypothetical protein